MSLVFEIEHCHHCHKHPTHHEEEDESTFVGHAEQVIRVLLDVLEDLSWKRDGVSILVNRRRVDTKVASLGEETYQLYRTQFSEGVKSPLRRPQSASTSRSASTSWSQCHMDPHVSSRRKRPQSAVCRRLTEPQTESSKSQISFFSSCSTKAALGPPPRNPGSFEVFAFDLEGSASVTLFSKHRAHRFPDQKCDCILSDLFSFLAATAARRDEPALLKKVTSVAQQKGLLPFKPLPVPLASLPKAQKDGLASRIRSAQDQIDSALAAGDPDNLREGLAILDSTGYLTTTAVTAQAKLDELSKARGQLQDALDNGDTESLQSALKFAMNVKLQEKEVKYAELRLQSLRVQGTFAEPTQRSCVHQSDVDKETRLKMLEVLLQREQEARRRAEEKSKRHAAEALHAQQHAQTLMVQKSQLEVELKQVWEKWFDAEQRATRLQATRMVASRPSSARQFRSGIDQDFGNRLNGMRQDCRPEVDLFDSKGPGGIEGVELIREDDSLFNNSSAVKSSCVFGMAHRAKPPNEPHEDNQAEKLGDRDIGKASAVLSAETSVAGGSASRTPSITTEISSEAETFLEETANLIAASAIKTNEDASLKPDVPPCAAAMPDYSETHANFSTTGCAAEAKEPETPSVEAPPNPPLRTRSSTRPGKRNLIRASSVNVQTNSGSAPCELVVAYPKADAETLSSVCATSMIETEVRADLSLDRSDIADVDADCGDSCCSLSYIHSDASSSEVERLISAEVSQVIDSNLMAAFDVQGFQDADGPVYPFRVP